MRRGMSEKVVAEAVKAVYEVCGGACEPHERDEVTVERRFDIPCEDHLAVKEDGTGEHFCIKCGAPLGS